MTNTNQKKIHTFTFFMIIALFCGACSSLVDFDRSKIKPDAGPDASKSDAGPDASKSDAGN